jgi:hypothetical protein
MNDLNLVELRKILMGQLDEFAERTKNGEEVVLIPSIISMDYSGELISSISVDVGTIIRDYNKTIIEKK